MKTKIMVVALALAVMFSCSFVFAAGETGSKVGILNIQKVILESKAGKIAKIEFDKEFESKRIALAAKEKSARATEDELKTSGAKMKADARKMKEEKLAEDIKEFQRLKQDMEEELKKKDNELTSTILKDILDISKKVGDEGGYSLILQASPQIVYMNNAIDITDAVLKKYDSGK